MMLEAVALLRAKLVPGMLELGREVGRVMLVLRLMLLMKVIREAGRVMLLLRFLGVCWVVCLRV
jgi:hypothetical protein